MQIEEVKTDFAPLAVGPYSQGVVAGNMVFTAGEIPVDPETGLIPESIESQSELAFKNLMAVVTAAGARVNQIVSVTVYLSNIKDFAAMNVEYGKAFEEPYPARSCIAAADLPKNVKIMVSAIAVKD